MKLEIINMPLNDLHLYEFNAKTHPDQQVKQIAESIEEFGFNDPIAVDANNRIIEGHGRYMAAQALGLESVPCIRLGHMTEEQERAYILVHNKLTMDTGFNMDVLQHELEAITDIDMGDYGFADFGNVDIDGFFSDLDGDATVADAKPKTVTCPKCGEVIEIG